MGELWAALAVAGILVAVVLVVWAVGRRKPAGRHGADQPAETVTPLDLPVSQAIPSRGVLVPFEPSEDSLTLRVVLRQDLERSNQSSPPFTLDYRTISTELMPRLGELTPLPRHNVLAKVMGELSAHIRQDSLAVRSGRTITLLRSDLDISKLYPAHGGGLRGWARNATNVVDQARFFPVEVPVEALDSTRRALIQVGKSGLVVAGLSISWPALALTAGFVALDAANQAQRRELDRRINTFILKTEQKELERRIARQRSNEQELNRLVSRVLDGTAPDPAEAAMLRTSILQEFNEARVAIGRLHGSLTRSQQGQSDAKTLVRDLELSQPRSVISDLLHARGAIDQQRRFLILEVASESLKSVAVAGGYYADTVTAQVGDTEDAERAFRELLGGLRKLELKEKNPLARRRNEKLTRDFRATLSLAFPRDGGDGDDDATIQSTFAVDAAGRVFQVASTVDIDAVEREDLHIRLAGALRELVQRGAEQERARHR